MKSLINIDYIINAPVINDPWPHKIIDNILPDEVFQKFQWAAQQLAATKKDDEYYADGIWPSDFAQLGLDRSLEDCTVAIADQLLSMHDKILKPFDRLLKSNLGYYNIPRFNYSIGKVNSAIHDEGRSKTMALVIYLIPDATAGTRLYNGPNEEHFVKEIEWKPNRGMLMVSEPNVTWHSYIGQGDPRYTLNLYFEKMESLPNLDNVSLDRKLWFYDKMSKDSLVTIL